MPYSKPDRSIFVFLCLVISSSSFAFLSQLFYARSQADICSELHNHQLHWDSDPSLNHYKSMQFSCSRGREETKPTAERRIVSQPRPDCLQRYQARHFTGVTASFWWCLLDVCMVVLSSLVSVCLFAGRWWLVLCHQCGPDQSPGVGYKRVSVFPLPVSVFFTPFQRRSWAQLRLSTTWFLCALLVAYFWLGSYFGE